MMTVTPTRHNSATTSRGRGGKPSSTMPQASEPATNAAVGHKDATEVRVRLVATNPA